MSKPASRKTDFIHGPVGPLFAKTAIPIVFLMGVNGLLTVVDAIFLGVYVGADALAAVTLMFPIVMMSIALATLVANGMASILARELGAGNLAAARASFAGAHGLTAIMCAGLLALFAIAGRPAVELASNGSGVIADLGYRYLLITIAAAPVAFALTLQSTALRVEGWVGFMALMGAIVSLANIALNWVLIGVLDWGVTGSAVGTTLAQASGLAIILIFRATGRSDLPALALPWHKWRTQWAGFLALGAPQSLAFVGLSLGTGTVIVMLQAHAAPEDYDATVAAYGIVMRLMSFSFLCLMGMAQALQALIGNNIGAGRHDRVARALAIAIACALVYGAIAQLVFTFGARSLAGLFVTDPAVIAEVARIMPVMVALYAFSGPPVMIATHFQAIGDAPRAAILGLARTYLFLVPLTLTMPHLFGEQGIWLASPVSGGLMLCLTIAVLAVTARRRGHRFGLIPRKPSAVT